MKTHSRWGLLLLPLLLASGTGGNTSEAQPGTEQNASATAAKVLFEDSMMDNWQKNWWLEGKKATVEHRETGLYFSGGTVTKRMDKEEYHAHHAVLWTRQVFEGDLRITYEMTRVDKSDYGNTLLYLQAQGIGTEKHPVDILSSKDQRDIPAMSEYFSYMDLISVSFREDVRCKRYPWNDDQGEFYAGRGLIEPKVDYIGMIPGKTYLVEVEKKADSVRLVLTDKESKEQYVDHTWDTTKIAEGIEPRLVQKGRIGLRHMSTKQFVYKDFKVEQL